MDSVRYVDTMKVFVIGLAFAVAIVDHSTQASMTSSLLFVAWMPILLVALFVVKTRRNTPHVLYFSVYTVTNTILIGLPDMSVNVLAMASTVGLSMAVFGALSVFAGLNFSSRRRNRQLRRPKYIQRQSPRMYLRQEDGDDSCDSSSSDTDADDDGMFSGTDASSNDDRKHV